MTMRAGCAEVEITPPLGAEKIGWLKRITPTRVADPLFARALVLDANGTRLAFVALDTLCVRWTTVERIRKAVETQYGIPAAQVMIAATHNHGGPAVANVGLVPRDDAYLASLEARVISALGQAVERFEPAEIGFGRGILFDAAFNRRVRMRDGTTITHGKCSHPLALGLEGPIDPELLVMGVRRPSGAWLGALVNYAVHPAHHGGDECFSAGWPGVLANELKARGVPCPLFLNGAYGNMATSDPARDGLALSMEETGRAVAQTAWQALQGLSFESDLQLSARRSLVRLPFREATEDQIKGTVAGAQRFIDPKIYDELMPGLLAQIRSRGTQPAEVQALRIGAHVFVSQPAELFVELGLAIKEGAHPWRAFVVGGANGMVGYVPTREAHARGGYETTFAPSSKLAPEAGEMLVAAALALLRD
ncbi:MAG: hypothetical protein HS116_25970 [Planctomycetes bacterium]|nr:hypothetical protein [Planctomycetota bacterium]